MHKIIYCLVLLFSLTAFSQDFKYCFSSRYAVTLNNDGGYVKGEKENIDGLFFFDLVFVHFELKGNPVEKLDFYGTGFDDRHPDIHEVVLVHSFRGPFGDFEIKLYQFLDRRIQIFSSYGGKNYLYIIDKVIDEDGTAYSVKT